MTTHSYYEIAEAKHIASYPLGLPSDFIVEPTAPVTDLIVDAFDGAAVLEDGVGLC